MTAIVFLAQWALRSSVLILVGALLLRILRVKDPSIRLAAWTAMLCGSLAIPVLTAALPKVPLAALGMSPAPAAAPASVPAVNLQALPALPPPAARTTARAGLLRPFDWARAAAALYALVAFALLLRLGVGLAMAARLVRASRPAGRAIGEIEIRESGRVRVPVTLGFFRPVIVLPPDWRGWDDATRNAVLAHERSHVLRRDPAIQVLSAFHRALLWHSPLSWFLHTRIVRVAEEASDDAAVAATRDRAFYAEVLMRFVRRGGARRAGWIGVPMARYGRPDERIHRILDETALSRGVTRWSLAAILLLGAPLAYIAAAAAPAASPQKPPASTPAPASAPKAATEPAEARPASQSRASVAPTGYLAGLGNVVPFQTVTIKSRVDGELLSVNVKEGDSVQQGQLLATIDPQPYEIQVQRAEGQIAQDQAPLAAARADLDRLQRSRSVYDIPPSQLDAKKFEIAQLEAKVMTDQAAVASAKLQLSYTHIHAPISGVVGLRLIDPGNVVHASDPTGILVINQIQPAAVVFTIPQDQLAQVRARMAGGAALPVELWNRDSSAKIATGRLTAVDNQIDPETGTAKLKAVFDNRDGALFPNQFVNVRLFLNSR